jgi:hypothetical protein
MLDGGALLRIKAIETGASDHMVGSSLDEVGGHGYLGCSNDPPAALF